MEPDDHLTHLSFDTAMAAIRQALRLAPDGLFVILHGGEPTLFFDLVKRIVVEGTAEAKVLRKPIRFGGLTNASRIGPEMIAFSTEYGVHWGISQDGPPALNSLRVLANGGDTSSHFLDALQKYPEFMRACGILSTITSRNQDHLVEIAAWFRDLGFLSWDWSLFQPIGMGREDEQMHGFDTTRLVAAWSRLFDAVESGAFDGFEVQPITDYVRNFLHGGGSNMCMRRECGAARDLLSISSDGSIEACDCIDRKGPLANLGLVQIDNPRSLEEARESPKAKLIRSRDVTQLQCGSCIWLSVCGGTCMAHAGSVQGLWEVQCRLAMNAFPRIATAMVYETGLRRYWRSVSGSRRHD